MNRYPTGEHPGCYFDPEDWHYRPCIRNNHGQVIWQDPTQTYWADIAATQAAKREAYRRFLTAYPDWVDDEEII